MSRVTSRPRVLLAVSIGLAMLLFAETVVLAATTKTGGPVKAVKVVTETATTAIAAQTFTDVAGMSVSMTVPSGEKALLLITYSAEVYCIGTPSAYCTVRVLVDGTEVAPGRMVFDSSADGITALARETNSMQFVAGPLSAGPHSIKVQALADEVGSGVTFNQRILSVLRSKV